MCVCVYKCNILYDLTKLVYNIKLYLKKYSCIVIGLLIN